MFLKRECQPDEQHMMKLVQSKPRRSKDRVKVSDYILLLSVLCFVNLLCEVAYLRVIIIIHKSHR